MPRVGVLIRHAPWVALIGAAWLCAGGAHAQNADSAQVADTAGDTTESSRPENGYWSVGEPRWFLSTKSDLGLYAKPYFSAGYGMPHWIWAGIDLNAITTTEMGQIYAGVRAASPVFDVSFGLRDTYSYGRPFLAPRASFSSEQINGATGPNARYWAWEAEAVGFVPLPYSAIMLDAIAVGVLDAPRDRYLYEESYRAVIGDSNYFVLRAATVARVLREDALKVGLLYEWLVGTGRDKNVFRMGPAAALQLTDHLEAVGTLSVVLHSPDALGIFLGSYGLAGLRYRWATGERAPELPWRGTMIPDQSTER
ncbi:MAG TPA: hypothetical protein VG963_02610 [Polyangiaceae bacterium]|nr:hypothetical protein [Polyangiaceae bacterium]